MNVAILAVGNEVLCGKIVDTNGAMISRMIETLGAKVVHREVVLDNVEEIVLGLKHAYEYANTVITIGGLGPTVDDLTRIGAAQFFNEPLVKDEFILEGIRQHFTKSGRIMPESNDRQAYRFETGTVLENLNGTAPGLFLKKDNKQIFLLPGPPNELLPMMEKQVLPAIKQEVKTPIISRAYRLHSIGESPAEEKIIHLYEKYPTLEIAPYCDISYIDYVVTAQQQDAKNLDAFEQDFLDALSEYHVGSPDKSLVVRVIEKLRKNNKQIAVAESCTGGMLATSFVDIPGVSDVFLEGLVTYSNEAKMKRLDVKKATLDTFGAVSKEVAAEMAQNLQSQTGANVTLSVTGIAGPDGGTTAKPVGLVYIGLMLDKEIEIFTYNFSGNRNKIRTRARDEALHQLFKKL